MAKTSQYWGVCTFASSGPESRRRRESIRPWQARIRVNGLSVKSYHSTEREAAIQVDRWILEHKLDKPLNILKAKPTPA